MNRSAAAIGIGVLAIAILVGVVLFLQLPSPDEPQVQAVTTPAKAPGNDTGNMREFDRTAASGAAGAAGASSTGASTVMEAQPAGPIAPEFDVVRVDKDGNVVIAGKAAPDCDIAVRDGETVVGTARSDRRGDWVIVPGEPLPAGEIQLGLTSKCGEAEVLAADRVVVLIVPERATETAVAAATPAPASSASASSSATNAATGATSPAVTTPAEPQVATSAARQAGAQDASGGGGAIAIAIPRDASKPSEIMQAPAAPADGVAITSVDYNDKGSVVISGKAAPGGIVQLYLDNRILGRAEADAGGNWRLEPDAAVEPGKYTLRADHVTPAGTVVARAEIPFLRGEPLSDLPEGRIVVIKPGDYLWKIARSSYGAGARYTQIYDANRGQISDPDLIYPGQVFTLPRVN